MTPERLVAAPSYGNGQATAEVLYLNFEDDHEEFPQWSENFEPVEVHVNSPY